ncbi:MAG: hypothetical protein LBT01_05610 [Spirochaetaceae bacterium]|jgi:hypothetical protein|nr:hypothetical protein [Spirochaetaceae bacterium]
MGFWSKVFAGDALVNAAGSNCTILGHKFDIIIAHETINGNNITMNGNNITLCGGNEFGNLGNVGFNAFANHVGGVQNTAAVAKSEKTVAKNRADVVNIGVGLVESDNDALRNE